MAETQSDKFARQKKERLERANILAREETSKILVVSKNEVRGNQIDVPLLSPVLNDLDKVVSTPFPGSERSSLNPLLKVETDFNGHSAIKWYDLTVTQINEITKKLKISRKLFLDIILED